MSIPSAQAPLDSSILPSSSSPSLIIVPATQAEYEQTWHLNADEWKGPLTLSQYFERERFLLSQDLTKNDSMVAWILTSTELPANQDGTRPILASCESLLKSGYVARNGSVERVRVHGVASVYTHPQYRGKGYAGRMMAELAKQLETFQQLNGDRGTFSVLFSDIGKIFYARHGWKAFPSTHVQLSPLNVEQYEETRQLFPSVQDIAEADLVHLPTTNYLETSMKQISEKTPHVPCIALRPDLDHFRWHHAREEVSCELQGLPAPDTKGALHKETGIAIIWCRTFSANQQKWTLHALHVVIPPEFRAAPTQKAMEAMAALLLRAQHEAFVWKMAAGVEVWDPTELTVSAAQSLCGEERGKIEVHNRDRDHVCCLRWLGSKTGDDEAKDVIWVNAEKYSWN